MTPTDMAKWAREAIKHSKIKQAELARQLTKTLRRPIDRAAVNKMLIVKETAKKKRRRIGGDELLAIAEITKFPLDFSPVMSVPRLAWVSAGELTEVVTDEFADLRVDAVGLDLNGDWIALTVEGTSMNRISPPESVIFVNRNDKQLVPNACYIIADEEGQSTYKRYRPGPIRFEPVSTEAGHETIFPVAEPVIVGRVRRTMLDL